MRSGRRVISSGFGIIGLSGVLLSGALGQGCGDDATAVTASPDASAADSSSSVPDSSTSSDAAAVVDTGTAGDSAGGDAGTDADAAAANEPKPVIVSLSAAGHDRFFAVTYDAQGNFYAAGTVSPGVAATDDSSSIVAKFLPTGLPDTTFGTNGVATLNLSVGGNGEVTRGIVIQSTGKIVIGATVDHVGATDARDRDIAVARFNANGTPDATFGVNGVAILDLSDGELVGDAGSSTTYVADAQWGLSLYQGDKLIVTGVQKAAGRTDTDFAMVRLTADGAKDSTFGTNASGVVTVDILQQSGSARGATILPDGSIVGSGYMREPSPSTVITPVLYKVNSSGALDTTFGTSGVFNTTVLAFQTEAYAVALQGTSFVTAGYGKSASTETLDWLSLRVTATGALDTTYGTAGVARIDANGFNDNARNVFVLPDNRVLLVGGGRPAADNIDGMVTLLTANGQPDTTFAPKGTKIINVGGPNDMLWSAAMAPDKKHIVLAGLKGGAAASDAGPADDDDCAFVILPVPN